MMRRVVDTNVAVVANGRETNAAPSCRLHAIEALGSLLEDGKIIVDTAGEMLAEYRRYCDPKGQPGVGDRFFREILMNYVAKIERIPLEKNEEGHFVDFPDDPALEGFDSDDRKFAAAARKSKAPVLNATDSDWLAFKEPLLNHGIEVKFVCGSDKTKWLSVEE